MAREPFGARLTSIWIGGLFYWMLTGFRGNFTNQLIDKHNNRNLWTGYVISIGALVLLAYLIFIKDSY